MTVYQLSAAFTAAVCSIMFFVSARAVRDKLLKLTLVVYAVIMAIATLSYLFIFLTDLDAEITSFVRLLTPIGWGTLAIIAARLYTRRNE